MTTRKRNQVNDPAFWENAADMSLGLYACWPWIGRRLKSGYGKWQETTAHRVAYQRFHGVTLTPEQLVMHSCDNPPYVNPMHLTVGTPNDNMQDMVAKGRSGNKPHPGTDNWNAKLTDDAVRKMRSLFDSGVTIGELATRFGTTHGNASKIVRRKAWTHVS